MTTLAPGDKAPVFEAIDQQGNVIKLADLLNKKTILFFYPKDNTPGCTAEACNLRDNYQGLLQAGFNVIGISPDSVKQHQNFAAKYELPFPLIPDTNREILEAYKVWGEKKNYGKVYMGVFRTTFVINTAGIIEKVFTKVKTKDHAAQILESYE